MIIASIIYVLATVPQTIPQNTCSFSGYVACRDMVIGSNAMSTRAVFLFSNSQQYSIENATATLNISGVGSFSGACSPNFILSGGDMECVININKQITENQLTNGNVYLSATVCTQSSEVGCKTPAVQTYGGTFTTRISPLVPPPGCSLSLSVTNSTQFATGSGDLLTANVKILDYNIAGATVDFTSNTVLVPLSPQFANTNSNGNSQSFASSNTSITANIMASFGNCNASTVINFVKPVYISFETNFPNTGSYILTVNGKRYSVLPEVIPTIADSAQSYSYNTSVSISNGARYHYSSISGCGATSQSGTVSSDVNCGLIAKYAEQYLLTTIGNPSAGGYVTPSTGWYNSGGQVTITENAYPGYSFTGWSCSGTGCYSGTSPSQSIYINNPITETANFQINQYTLTVNNNGCSSVSGGGNYNYGSSEPFSVIVPGGYTFTGWTGRGTGSYSGNATSQSVTMDNAITETATCTPPSQFTFTENAFPSAGGTLSPGTGSYATGTQISISETPTAGYTFKNWTSTEVGSYSGISASPPKITINNPITETANYQITLTVNNNGCSSVSGSGTYNYGSHVNFSVVVPNSYTFTGWTCTGSGCYSGSATSKSVLIDNPITETATCSSIPTYQFTENAIPSNGGTVSPGSGFYTAGNHISISEIPNTGYTFKNWTGTGIGSYTGTSQSNTITINNAITETANFQVNQYALTVNNNGCSSVSGGGTYNYNSSVIFSVVVPNGYSFAGWAGTGPGSYSGSATSQSVIMANPITETATCTPPSQIPFTEYANPSAGGTVSPGSGSYIAGNHISITENANSGYVFASWNGIGAGSYTGPSTFNVITINNAITEVANYQITLTVNNNGCSSVSGSGILNYGSPATFSVVVPNGYTFTGWTGTGAGSYSGTATTQTITINNPITENAICSIIPTYQFTENAVPSTGGTVHPGSGSYAAGTQIQIFEYNNTGYVFKNWTGTGSGSYSGTVASPPTITINNAITETANYQVTLTLINNGCTSVSGGGNYNYGSSQTFSTIVPNGYTLAWTGTGTGSYTGSSTSPSVTINNPITETASCSAPNTYPFTENAVPSAGGTVYPGSGTYTAGTQIQIFEYNNTGYVFKNWTGTGAGSYSGTSASPQTVTINSAITEVANYKVTLTLINNGCSSVSGSGNYNYGSSAPFSAVVPNGYTLSWTGTGKGNYTGSSQSPSVTMDYPITEFATCSAPNTYPFTEYANPSGAGTVSPGSGSYAAGTQITISQLNNTGYVFKNWTGLTYTGASWVEGGAGSYSGTSTSPQTVTINSPTEEIANYQLRLTLINNGCSSVSGSGTYNYGSTANYSVVVPSSSVFAGWTGNGGATGATSQSVIMANPITETATCTAVSKYQFIESASPSAGGTVHPGSGTYTAGNQITISEAPSACYTFTGWTGNGIGSYSGTSTSPTITMNNNITEIADYQPNTYPFIESPTPQAGGSVGPGSATYPCGSLTLTETPNPGYTFTGWTGTAYTGTTASPKITINNPVSENATFQINSYSITTTASPSDGGTVSGSGAYNYGNTVTVSETPAPGYTFTGWTSCTGSASSCGTQSSFTISGISSNGTVTANFQATPPATTTLTVQESPSDAANYWGACVAWTTLEGATGQVCAGPTVYGGSGTASATVTVPYGTLVTDISAAPWANAGTNNGGYTFASWSGAYSSTNANPGYGNWVEVTGPTTIQANFQQQQIYYTLTESYIPDNIYNLSIWGQPGGLNVGCTNCNGAGLPVCPTSYYTSQGTCYGGSDCQGGYYNTCVDTFSISLPAGQQVILTENDWAGSYPFYSWAGTGSGSYSGTSTSPTITMYGNITETGTFSVSGGYGSSNNDHDTGWGAQASAGGSSNSDSDSDSDSNSGNSGGDV